MASSYASSQATQASSERYRPPKSTDIGWDYGQRVDGDNTVISCDFCGHTSRGGIRGFKHHIVKGFSKSLSKYKDVQPCKQVSKDVEKVLKYMNEKEKVTQEREKQRRNA
ncbi:hypothetical protein AQUCO_01200053v1 [Aquilegia coerulea]|uniref:BED-type domain-containing protein n=1 Tax=Aquilegia coerulea TaxID=218851 RepID=A0A2G5E479_AQUCA|nr:hypothetical protein AQUCO_01200053v1 [Aquilegia coerulea]